MAEIDDLAGGLLGGVTEIRVDPAAVDRFASTLETEIDTNFTPTANHLQAVYQPGANFGVLHQSPAVQAARVAQAASLRAATAQLESYIAASKILIEAARTVAARYREVDDLTGAKFDDVQAVLDDAAARSDAALAAAHKRDRLPGNVQ
jgi:hypothetical protein